MSHISEPMPPLRKPRRRWWKRLLIGLLLAILVPTVIYRFNAWRLNRQLEEVIAELDAADPGWRLEEIEKGRKEIADEKNGARIVTASVGKAPAGWFSNPAWSALEWHSPAVRLPEDTVGVLRTELEKAQEALAEAAQLREYPSGRHPITYASDYVSTQVAHIETIRNAVSLLRLEAIAASEDGDVDRAWRACDALVNAGETVGEEPTLISQLVRMAVHNIAVSCMERAVAQGGTKSKTLAAARARFARLAQDNLFIVGVRGERAGFHHLLNNALDGNVYLADLGAKKDQDKANLFDRIAQPFAGNKIREANIYLLRQFTRAIAAAKLPDVERQKALLDLDMEMKTAGVMGDAPKLALLLFPAVRKVDAADLGRRALLGCACVALAAEQYRLTYKRWPESVEQLVKAGLLVEPPLDPFDGQPLRWRPTPDGLVIYSVGVTGKYDGTALDEGARPGTERSEFRLWNPDRRGQPAPPPKKEDDEK
jgi:hypothetical protein